MSAPQTLPPRTSGPHVPVSTEYVPRPPVWDEISSLAEFAIVDGFLDSNGHQLVVDLLQGGDALETWKKAWREYRDRELERLAR